MFTFKQIYCDKLFWAPAISLQIMFYRYDYMDTFISSSIDYTFQWEYWILQLYDKLPKGIWLDEIHTICKLPWLVEYPLCCINISVIQK